MGTIHPIQISILKKLMYSPGLRYSHMKLKSMEGSQFTFHLEQLLQQELIRKEDSLYLLTEKGKSIAGKLDLSDTTISEQAKVSVLLICSRVFEGKSELLLYTRKKTPFYGYQGFPTGKVKKGEDILHAAERELLEETGLQGETTLIALRHYRIFQKSNSQLLEDKVYFVMRIHQTSGDLISGPEGDYRWIDAKNLWDYLKKPVPEIQEIVEHMDDTSITFKEGEYYTDEF